MSNPPDSPSKPTPATTTLCMVSGASVAMLIMSATLHRPAEWPQLLAMGVTATAVFVGLKYGKRRG